MCYPGRDAPIVLHKSVVFMGGYQGGNAAFYIWIGKYLKSTILYVNSTNILHSYNRLCTNDILLWVTFTTLWPVPRLIDEGKLSVILAIHREVGHRSVILEKSCVTSAIVGQALALELLILPFSKYLLHSMFHATLSTLHYLIGVNSSVTSSKNES